jgi:hypothetical protein
MICILFERANTSRQNNGFFIFRYQRLLKILLKLTDCEKGSSPNFTRSIFILIKIPKRPAGQSLNI